mmetsp:Transcript_29695/g.84989  ORF Transcript_29695/g.84989 Transcript_29695/m.84989 type:complete len:384 (+) Transcript_29695:53-1204(+)
MAPEVRALECADEIELTSVPSGAQHRPTFSPDEPAKVHVAATGEQYPEEAAMDMEKECLWLENAALKEALAQQQQQNINWLWQSPSDWCQTQDAWGIQGCLQPGAQVAFQGLKSAVELNGQLAVVERWDEASERWVVRLASGEDKFAKPENLVPACSPWPAFCPGYAWQGYADRFEPARQTGRGRKPSGAGAATKKVASPNSSFISSNNSSFVSDSTAPGRCQTSSFSSCGSWEGGSDENKTTVMMRNIPNDYTREMLLKLLDKEGFLGSYDLVYLPIDYHSKVGFGYAFINLVTTAEAERFRAHFTDFAKWDVVSQKVCEVCWSSVLQGVQAHVDRYRNSPVMHEAVRDEFKPVLFENGKRIPFPGPTKSIRAPRARRRDSK